jgi:hypothetical protein
VKRTRPGGGRGTSDGGLSNVTNGSVSRRGFELLIQSSSYCPLHILQCFVGFALSDAIVHQFSPGSYLFQRSSLDHVVWLPGCLVVTSRIHHLQAITVPCPPPRFSFDLWRSYSPFPRSLWHLKLLASHRHYVFPWFVRASNTSPLNYAVTLTCGCLRRTVQRNAPRGGGPPKRSPTPTSATFAAADQPPPSPGGAAQKPLYLCSPFVDAAMLKGNFKTIVMLPKYVDVMEWVAKNSAFDFLLLSASLTHLLAVQSSTSTRISICSTALLQSAAPSSHAQQ